MGTEQALRDLQAKTPWCSGRWLERLSFISCAPGFRYSGVVIPEEQAQPESNLEQEWWLRVGYVQAPPDLVFSDEFSTADVTLSIPNE